MTQQLCWRSFALTVHTLYYFDAALDSTYPSHYLKLTVSKFFSSFHWKDPAFPGHTLPLPNHLWNCWFQEPNSRFPHLPEPTHQPSCSGTPASPLSWREGSASVISLYLKLVSFPADAASQTWFFYKLLHLFKQRRLGHYLTLLIRLKEKTNRL